LPGSLQGEDFLFYDQEGGENPLAFTKKEKQQMLDKYQQWMKQSQAIYVLSYGKMQMKDIDNLRAKARETGSEIHMVKNTLMARVLEQNNLPGADLFDGPSIAAFASHEIPGLAKVLSDATKGDLFKIKGGLLGTRAINADQVKALADLPPLDVMRARILGAINAPAAQLARTIAEPARGLAAVVGAYARAAEGGDAAAA
jgi:large subunit ribosomal protein L10